MAFFAYTVKVLVTSITDFKTLVEYLLIFNIRYQIKKIIQPALKYVTQIYKKLHKQQLIFKGFRCVIWCQILIDKTGNIFTCHRGHSCKYIRYLGYGFCYIISIVDTAV